MTAVLRVMKPGVFTTVQDLGRPKALAAGVPRGGAMDRFAHSAANLLVGNDPGRATLECLLGGLEVIAEHSCLIAITGADLDPRINGSEAPLWTGAFLGAGDRLAFGARRTGARAYLAIAGGIEADRWFGSLSTYLLVARGGMHGRQLQAGDLLGLAAEPPRPSVAGRSLAEALRPDYANHTLGAIAGPHVKRLDTNGRHLLFTATFKVSRDADRMAYRFDGPKLESAGGELLSFGLAVGAIQVPRNGQPILLMADHGTAGGYPVAATVVSAAIPIAAQLMPGDEVRFTEVKVEPAQQMRKALNSALDSLRTVPAR